VCAALNANAHGRVMLPLFRIRIFGNYFYCDEAVPPIFVPMTSPEMMISTRRFC
jgi:hypothetical protein